jgi:hypothetical protein
MKFVVVKHFPKHTVRALIPKDLRKKDLTDIFWFVQGIDRNEHEPSDDAQDKNTVLVYRGVKYHSP